MNGVLANLTGPEDLRRLPVQDLPRLAAEIRRTLVSAVTRTGGHLGPNLGVVELTIAVHRCFCSPRDPIVWDTGHQAYVHKLLTGRQDLFGTLRQYDGLSGYPNRTESAHDLVENSHASTALSYADGLTQALSLTGETGRRVVAVVGDGALTGGMSWEALNNIGRHRRPLVVLLNDNGRSYAPTAGSLADHLARLRDHTAEGNVFEELGLAYLGPVDGHDLDALETTLESARDEAGPVVVHCVTRKGAGHRPAETDEVDRLHTVGATPASPVTPSAGPSLPSWTSVFGDAMVRLGRDRADVVAVTAAMLRPTGLHEFATRFPDRVVDVGIAEQHAVTSAAGLATAGLHPVVALYATFLGRAFDQVLMDVALHRLPVTFALDRAGVTGPDGPSHHGMWDLSLLGLVPGLSLAAPRDDIRLRELLGEAVAHQDGPTVVRYPKGTVDARLPAESRLGGADVVVRTGTSRDVLILAAGPLAGAAVQAAQQLRHDGVGATVADPRWIAPVDPALVLASTEHRLVVTVEDNTVAGGFGDAFARSLRSAGLAVPLVTLGLSPGFLRAGTRSQLLHEQGLDADGITTSVRSALGSDVRAPAVRHA